MKAYYNAFSGKIGMKNDNARTKPWQELIALCAKSYFKCKNSPQENAVSLVLEFFMPRPKSVKKTTNSIHLTKPDLDKLARTVLDALTGIAYKDDSQVICCTLIKKYGNKPGVKITAMILD